LYEAIDKVEAAAKEAIVSLPRETNKKCC